VRILTTLPGCRLDDIDAQLLSHPLGVLNLTVRASNCLRDVPSIDALLAFHEAELIQTRNFGRTSLLDVRRKLVHFCVDHLVLPPGHPVRMAISDPHPALKGVWEAPAQERCLREVVGEILACLGRADEIRTVGTWSASPTSIGPPRRCDYDSASLAEVCAAFFQCLKERERRILDLRYGSLSSPGATLAEVGQSLGLTRERVRQIVQGCLGRLSREEERQRREPLMLAIRNFSTEQGDVLREVDVAHFLIGRYAAPHVDIGPLVRVLLEVEPEYAPVGQGVWVAGSYRPQTVLELQDGLHSLLRAAATPLRQEELLADLRRKSAVAQQLSEPFLRACLRTDDRLASDEEGRYGLVEWQWLLPRTLDDYVYLALRSAARPRHYMWITQQVNTLIPDDDEVIPRDVHGTLLDRTDLFRRYREGTYALREWGDEGVAQSASGAHSTAAGRDPSSGRPALNELIQGILRERGQPMTLDEIASRVSQGGGGEKASVAVLLESPGGYWRTADGRYGLSDWSRRVTDPGVAAEAVS
jgi:hypothetical protein